MRRRNGIRLEHLPFILRVLPELQQKNHEVLFGKPNDHLEVCGSAHHFTGVEGDPRRAADNLSCGFYRAARFRPSASCNNILMYV